MRSRPNTTIHCTIMAYIKKSITAALISIPILCFFTNNVMTIGRIQGESMAPTLHTGDYVLIIKNRFRKLFFLRNLQPGDVVFFKSPQDSSVCCKRIKFEQHQAVDMINEKTVDEVHVVPKNHFFMVGDNLNNSIDSRKYGYVSNGLIVGYVSQTE